MKKIIIIILSIAILLMGCSSTAKESYVDVESSVAVDSELTRKPAIVSIRMENVEAYKIIDSGFKAAINNNVEYISLVFSADDIDYSTDPHCNKVKEFLDSINEQTTAVFCYNFKSMGFQGYFQDSDIFCSEVSDGYVDEYSYVDVLAHTPSLSNIYSVAGECIANNCSEDDTCGFAYMTARAVEEESSEFIAIEKMTEQIKDRVDCVAPYNVEFGESYDLYTTEVLNYIEQNNISVLFCSRLISSFALKEIKETYPDIKIIYANTLIDGINCVVDGTVEMAVDYPLYDLGYMVASELINCINGTEYINDINLKPYCLSTKEDAQKYLDKIMQDYPPAS